MTTGRQGMANNLMGTQSDGCITGGTTSGGGETVNATEEYGDAVAETQDITVS